MVEGKIVHEIPIYAMDKERLHKKYAQEVSRLRTTYCDSDESTLRRIIEIETYPQRLWEYNHLVGYIRVAVTNQDVLFDIFLPVSAKTRYRWRSSGKVFLYDVAASGTHFYVNDKMPNCRIQMRVAEMLDNVINIHVPRRYYVDRRAFDNTNRSMNYRKIMNE